MSAQTCQCGHVGGDHKSNRSPTFPRFGVCLITGCGCKEFAVRDTRDEPERRAAA